MIVKTAPQHRFQTEKELLKQYSGRQGFRQLVDEIDEQPPTPAFLVLKHLDDNVLNASRAKRLNRVDIKFISRKILEVLQVLHEDGYVHTGRCSVILNVLVHDSTRLCYSRYLTNYLDD